MIRLRCETGIRPRSKVDWQVPRAVWLGMARSCAWIQARSLIARGRRRVDMGRVQELHSELDLMVLYEAGILELIAWQEHDRTGALLKIRSADLSLEAGLALVGNGLLPNALMAPLLAPDLLQQTDDLSLDRRVLDALAEWSGFEGAPLIGRDFIFDTSAGRAHRLVRQCFAIN